ncbi:hypothetical protein ABVT39_000670 [Epinephelus coioides]
MCRFKFGDALTISSLKKADVVLDNLRSTYDDDDLTLNSSVYVAHTVSVLGQTYRTSCVLPLKVDNNGEPLFGEIIHIIPQADVSILMFVRILTVTYFDEHFYAYAVQKTKEYEMISRATAADFRPLDIMSGFNADELYLNPRHKIV